MTELNTKFWVDAGGRVQRVTDETQDIAGLTAVVDPAPVSGKQIWNSRTGTWGPPPAIPDPDAAIDAAIDAAASLDELKAALKGQVARRR